MRSWPWPSAMTPPQDQCQKAGHTMQGQRRYERVAFFCPVDLTVLPDGKAVSANAFDISLGGVGLAAPMVLNRGQMVRVRFHLRNNSIGRIDEDVLGKVAYSRADEDGDRIGVEFLETVQESSNPALTRALNKL